jgi:hypothetical protein
LYRTLSTPLLQDEEDFELVAVDLQNTTDSVPLYATVASSANRDPPTNGAEYVVPTVKSEYSAGSGGGGGGEGVEGTVTKVAVNTQKAPRRPPRKKSSRFGRKKKLTQREREIEEHQAHVLLAEQMMLRKTAELRISDLERKKSDVEHSNMLEKNAALEKKALLEKSAGDAVAVVKEISEEEKEKARTEGQEQMLKDAEEAAKKQWTPGCGKELLYGSFVITSDQAESIHALKVELSRPQTVKHTTTDERSVEIQWLGLEKEPLSPHQAVRCRPCNNSPIPSPTLAHPPTHPSTHPHPHPPPSTPPTPSTPSPTVAT